MIRMTPLMTSVAPRFVRSAAASTATKYYSELRYAYDILVPKEERCSRTSG